MEIQRKAYKREVILYVDVIRTTICHFCSTYFYLTKISIEGINSNLVTAIRTAVVVIMAWGMVFLTHAQNGLVDISRKIYFKIIDRMYFDWGRNSPYGNLKIQKQTERQGSERYSLSYIRTEWKLEKIMNRQQIFDYVMKTYGTTPEYLWMRYPAYAVLRHQDNEKWYGVVMNVPKNRLGLQGTDFVDILDVKCDPVMIDILRQSSGFLPAYHMNKTNWLSILLDDTVSDDQILDLLDMSYQMTAKKKK